MQAKRIKINTNDAMIVGSFNGVSLDVPSIPREEVNFHNIWASFTAEPENADANAQGTWVLYIVKVGGSEIGFNDATINGEVNNFFIIACGVWAASNEMPYTSPPIHPSTSRTLNPGDRLALSVTVTGLTAGQVTSKANLCAHTTRK